MYTIKSTQHGRDLVSLKVARILHSNYFKVNAQNVWSSTVIVEEPIDIWINYA